MPQIPARISSTNETLGGNYLNRGYSGGERPFLALELMSSQELAKHESWDNFWVPIRGDERGDRIAVDVLTLRGGNRFLDISSHVTSRRIAVYDIEAGKELASIPVRTSHLSSFDFDLSPNGRHLAILEDD